MASVVIAPRLILLCADVEYCAGTLGMLVMPYVAHQLFSSSQQAAGIFLGLAVHDTAQVRAPLFPCMCACAPGVNGCNVFTCHVRACLPASLGDGSRVDLQGCVR